MKKGLLIVFSVLLIIGLSTAIAESTDDWATAPVFIKAYEQSVGKIYIEWKGNAPVYQIHVDGNKVADVIVNHSVIDIQKGAHSIVIYPIYEIRDADTKVDVNIDAKVFGGGLSIDLASLGLDPKHLVAGNPSEKLNIDYKPSQIMNGTPDSLSAYTDPDNRVVFTFSDQYTADEYMVTVKHRNDINYVSYYINGEAEADLVKKTNNMVSLILDPAFLRGQECMVPELNEEYRLSVQMRKYGINILNGEKEKSIILESKNSPELVYRMTAAWKTAPIISFASQTADGQITLQWDHEDYGAGCEYVIMKINKVLGVMTGEEHLGTTKEHEFIVNDLTNGGYCINIVPVLNGEKGSYSADANIDLKNEWVVAPELSCEQVGKQVKLTWKAPSNIETYHIIVYTGDNDSLLRFVDLDYSKYTEFDVPAVEGEMEYLFTYDKEIDAINGVKMKFEIVGVRHTASGNEQKSAVSSKTIVVK